MIEQQLQQIALELGMKYSNFNSEITLLSSLNIIDHKIWSIDKVKSLARSDPISNNVVDIVLTYLPLNTKSKIIVCEIMHYTICNQTIPRPERLDQLLLVIRGKSGISKSQFIYIIS